MSRRKHWPYGCNFARRCVGLPILATVFRGEFRRQAQICWRTNVDVTFFAEYTMKMASFDIYTRCVGVVHFTL